MIIKIQSLEIYINRNNFNIFWERQSNEANYEPKLCILSRVRTIYWETTNYRNLISDLCLFHDL